MSNATIEHIHAHQKASASSRGRTVYLIRTRPEDFPPDVVESVHRTREAAILAIGDVVDWDCDKCEHAVITTSLADPCPRCGHHGWADESDAVVYALRQKLS